jgi:hypothetical protein
MNKRIRELAEQAKNDLVTEIHSKATGMDINIVKIIVLGSKLKDDYAQDFSTKFAELLIRECAEFIAPLGDYCGGHGEPPAPSSRECARRLKQYFGIGVEE